MAFKATRLAAAKQRDHDMKEVRRGTSPASYVVLCNRCKNRFKLAEIDDNGYCSNCRETYGISKG